MWRGGRTTSARRTGRSSSASRAALNSRPSMGDEKPVGPVGGRTRFVSRFQKRLRAQRNFGFATKSASSGNGGYWGGQFTPRGTTYVFVNVVVAPRYVARVQLGSGGLKQSARQKPTDPWVFGYGKPPWETAAKPYGKPRSGVCFCALSRNGITLGGETRLDPSRVLPPVPLRTHPPPSIAAIERLLGSHKNSKTRHKKKISCW